MARWRRVSEVQVSARVVDKVRRLTNTVNHVKPGPLVQMQSYFHKDTKIKVEES